MKILVSVIATLSALQVGCATQNSYKYTMNSWNNESVQHLEKSWGAPNVVNDQDDKRIFSYNHKKLPTGASCQSQFLIEKEKVVGWRSVGTGCVFTQEQVNRLTADSATWNTKETQAQERKPTECITSAVGGVGFTSCQ